MKSRTFFFNGAVLKKNLQRCIPLLAVYTAFWLLLLPLYLLRTTARDPGWLANYAHASANSVGTVVNLFYGLGIAMVLFSYLFQARSANMIHTFPVRREGLFLTNYVSGLLCSLGPNLLLALISLVIVGGQGSEYLLHWFAIMTLEYVFYFSFACLLAQLTGHIVALPILYIILNFAVYVLELICRGLLVTCLYGLSVNISASLDFLSPPLYTVIHGSTSVGQYSLWKYLLILCAVGFVMALAALLLYRRRRIETAGDVIAVPALRPVFKYCFTAGCAIVLGFLIATFLGIDTIYGNILPLTICLLVGAFFGYFGCEMALKKRIFVFRREWLGFAAFAACLLLLIGLCRLDAFGFNTYVPAETEIRAVSLSFGAPDSTFSEDPDAIRAVRALHQKIVDEQPSAGERYERYTVSVRYALYNGKTVSRTYQLLLSDDPMNEAHELTQQLTDTFNQPALILARDCPPDGLEAREIAYAEIYFYSPDPLPAAADESTSVEVTETENSYLSLTGQQLVELYENAILPDILDGCFTTWQLNWRDETYARIDFSTHNDQNNSNRYYYFNITERATRTCEAIRQLQAEAAALGENIEE